MIVGDEFALEFLEAQDRCNALHPELRRAELSLFRGRCRAVFAQHPRLESFAWLQGVQYNDCWDEYSINLCRINGEEASAPYLDDGAAERRRGGKPESPHSSWWRPYAEGYDAEVLAVMNILRGTFQDFGRDFFRETFGGAALVTVTRAAISVQLFLNKCTTPPLLEGALPPTDSLASLL